MERETRGCFGDAGLRRRANRAVKPNGPVTGGGRVRRERTYPRSSASQAKQQSTPLGLPHNEGWRPGTRSGRSAARFGSVSAWGPGRGRAGTGPDSTCGEDLTELGDWPRKGLPVAWQRGPTTRLLHCGGAETGAHGWDRASLTACEPTMGLLLFSVGRVAVLSPEHCRLRPNVQDPGWPPLEPRTRAGGGQLGEATLNHRRGARVPDPGPDEQSGVGAGGSKQAHQTYPCRGSCQMGCCFELFGRRALGGRASQAHLDRYGPGKSLTIASFEIIMVGRDCRSVGRDSRCGAAGFRHSWGTARKAGAKCRTKGRKQTCEPLQIVVVYLAVRELLRFR